MQNAIYFFGAWSKDKVGHYLYAPGGWTSSQNEKELPFRYSILDAGLLDQGKSQPQGLTRRVVIGGWTILTYWDQQGDSRPGSNSAFVARGVLRFEEVVNLARQHFPEQLARLPSMQEE